MFHQKNKAMNDKAFIKEHQSGFTVLNWFNSKEIYYTKGFDTKRKAMNYAKKYGTEVVTSLPEGITKDYNN